MQKEEQFNDEIGLKVFDQSNDIRFRRISKLDEANDSFKINQKKYENEKPFTLGLNTLIADLRNKNQTQHMVAVKQPELIDNPFRRRIITSYQQNLRLKQYSSAILCKKQSSENCFMLPHEELNQHQQIKTHQWKLIRGMNTDSNLTLYSGNPNNGNSKLYFRIIHNSLINEQHDEAIFEYETASFDTLIENAQVADKYLNDYGLFYVLKQGMKDQNVRFLITGESQSFSPSRLEKEEKRGKPILQNHKPFKTNLLGFQELPFMSSTYSLIKFQLIFLESEKINYKFLKQNFSETKTLRINLEQIINKVLDKINLTNQKIIWLRLHSRYEYNFILEFIIPTFKDNLEITFINELFPQIKEQFSCIQDILSMPLMSPMEFSLQNLDPWFNREYKNQSHQQWRLYAMKVDTTYENTGYMNIFYHRPEDRQDLSKLNMGNLEGFLIVKNFALFEKYEQQYSFLKSKWINLEVYGETKKYKLFLRVSFNKQIAQQASTGDLLFDSQVYIVNSLEDLRISGLLVQEYMEGQLALLF